MYEPPHNLERNKAVGNGQTETQDLDSHFLLCSLACKPSAALLTAKAGWAVGSLYTCCQMLNKKLKGIICTLKYKAWNFSKNSGGCGLKNVHKCQFIFHYLEMSFCK